MEPWKIENINKLTEAEEEQYTKRLEQLMEEINNREKQIAELEDEKADYDAEIAYTRRWRSGLIYCACILFGVPAVAFLSGATPLVGGIATLVSYLSVPFVGRKSMSLMHNDQNRDDYGQSMHKYSVAASKDARDEIKDLQKEIKEMNKEIKEIESKKESRKR